MCILFLAGANIGPISTFAEMLDRQLITKAPPALTRPIGMKSRKRALRFANKLRFLMSDAARLGDHQDLIWCTFFIVDILLHV
jgi:hypothetical protein